MKPRIYSSAPWNEAGPRMSSIAFEDVDAIAARSGSSAVRERQRRHGYLLSIQALLDCPERRESRWWMKVDRSIRRMQMEAERQELAQQMATARRLFVEENEIAATRAAPVQPTVPDKVIQSLEAQIDRGERRFDDV